MADDRQLSPYVPSYIKISLIYLELRFRKSLFKMTFISFVFFIYNFMSAYYALVQRQKSCIRKMKEGGKNTNEISKLYCM